MLENILKDGGQGSRVVEGGRFPHVKMKNRDVAIRQSGVKPWFSHSLACDFWQDNSESYFASINWR